MINLYSAFPCNYKKNTNILVYSLSKKIAKFTLEVKKNFFSVVTKIFGVHFQKKKTK